jgi:putative salt-induced outer membrane protein YdiY
MTQAEWLAEFAAVLRAAAQQGVQEPAGRDPLSAKSPVVGNGHFGYRVCRGGE